MRQNAIELRQLTRIALLKASQNGARLSIGQLYLRDEDLEVTIEVSTIFLPLEVRYQNANVITAQTQAMGIGNFAAIHASTSVWEADSP
jgi:hypothetical protein